MPDRGAFALPSITGCVIACALGAGILVSAVGAQPVRVGVRAGPTFGYLNDSPIPFIRAGEKTEISTNVRLDVHGGVYAVVPLANRFGLQTELLYVRKGGHFSRYGDDSYRVEQYQLSYLEGQVLGRLDIVVPGPLSLHVLGGVTGGRLLEGIVRRDIHARWEVLQEEIDLQAQGLVRRWDVGGLVGIGLGYPIGASGRLALELRYNRGFRSVFTRAARPADQHLGAFDDPPPLSRVPPPLRHDVITASLAYTIPLSQ